MCGRFRQSRKKEILAEHFDVEPDAEWHASFNIAPTQNIAVIRQHRKEPKRVGSTMRWGLIPFWARDVSGAHKMINLRSETIAEKPAFREILRKRRCLIPADGFYEWKKQGKGKIPFCFTLADDNLFAFPGLWERWKSPEGQIAESCSIITTPPNRLSADVHDRMPAILDPDNYDLWLDPAFQNVEELCAMLKPLDASLMKKYEVSPRVNSVENDDPGCSDPVPPVVAGENAQPPKPQATLFPLDN